MYKDWSCDCTRAACHGLALQTCLGSPLNSIMAFHVPCTLLFCLSSFLLSLTIWLLFHLWTTILKTHLPKLSVKQGSPWQCILTVCVIVLGHMIAIVSQARDAHCSTVCNHAGWWQTTETLKGEFRPHKFWQMVFQVKYLPFPVLRSNDLHVIKLVVNYI